MSISHEQEAFRRAEEEALAILREKKENPFDLLANPHRAAANFADLHVPEVHAQEYAELLARIDAYRVREYDDYQRLMDTRVVLLLGNRGAGKTHLLQAVINRDDRKAQLVVRPSTLESGQEFAEYLLGQIRIGLGEQDEFHPVTPLELISRSITRRLVLQTLRGLSATQRLFTVLPDAPRSWLLLWSGADKKIRKANTAITKLAEKSAANNLRAIVVDHGLDPKRVMNLVECHLRRLEAGTNLVQVVRKGLYTAMARRVLLEDAEALPHFLREGYIAQNRGGDSRADLVRPLLQVLIEACALCQMPVIVAFDNFERLFSPTGKFEKELAVFFFNNLAQAVDTSRGILFLLSFEEGLWETQGAPSLTEGFAGPRIEQLIVTPTGRYSFRLKLKYPSPDEVNQLISTRMQKLLEPQFKHASLLRKAFPFADRFVAQLTGDGQSVGLRSILRQLRDAYDAIVFGPAHAAPPISLSVSGPALAPTPVLTQTQIPSTVAFPLSQPTPPAPPSPTPPPPEPVTWPAVLDSFWKRAMQAVRRASGETTIQELHECLGFLAQAIGEPLCDGWVVTKLQPIDPIGDNPSYGIVTRIDLKRSEGANPDGPREIKLGIGFLLAQRRGTLVDLRAKFDFFHKYERGGRLVILWPTPGGSDPVESMSPGTREVWEANRQHHRRTQVRRITEQELRTLLGVRQLARLLQDNTDQPPPGALAQLLRDRLESVLLLLSPPYLGSSE